MADQAKVTSLDALESFRSHLVIYVKKAQARLDEVADEVRRARMWLQNDQRMFWEGEIRRRQRVLDQAEQELMTARLSSLRDGNTLQMMAVRKARSALEEAREKLLNVKRWTRTFDSQVEPALRKMESLRGVLEHDLPQGIARLVEVQRTLDDYAGIGPAGAIKPPPAEVPAGTPGKEEP